MSIKPLYRFFCWLVYYGKIIKYITAIFQKIWISWYYENIIMLFQNVQHLWQYLNWDWRSKMKYKRDGRTISWRNITDRVSRHFYCGVNKNVYIKISMTMRSKMFMDSTKMHLFPIFTIKKTSHALPALAPDVWHSLTLN